MQRQPSHFLARILAGQMPETKQVRVREQLGFATSGVLGIIY